MPTAVKAPVAVPAPLPPWTGFYVGGNIGWGWGKDQDVVVRETIGGAPFISGTWPGVGTFGNLGMDGVFGGGQVGYNWQTGIWVLGIEADIQASDINGSAGATLPYISGANTISITTTGKLDWFGTVRARAGITWDRALIYATGGVAFGKVKYNQVMTDTLAFVAAGNGSSDSVGWTLGGGIEYLVLPNWSIKGEYQYLDFGSKTFILPEFTTAGAPTAFAIATNLKSQFHTARFGINYHFR